VYPNHKTYPCQKKENHEEGLRNWKERRIKTYQVKRQNEGIDTEKLERKNSNVKKDEENNKRSHRQINKSC
jgi:hypothetical protein